MSKVKAREQAIRLVIEDETIDRKDLTDLVDLRWQIMRIELNCALLLKQLDKEIMSEPAGGSKTRSKRRQS